MLDLCFAYYTRHKFRIFDYLSSNNKRIPTIIALYKNLHFLQYNKLDLKNNLFNNLL